MSDPLICTFFNVTEERVKELVDKYARDRFTQYLEGKISSGDFLSAFVNIEELTTNEKCFLTSHCTQAAMMAQMEVRKKIKLAELLSGVF